MFSVNGSRGQAVLEFSIISLVIFTFVMGCLLIFKAEWDRLRCSYSVFESTHRRLVQGRQQGFDAPSEVVRGLRSNLGSARSRLVRVWVDESGAHGTGVCGGVEERVDLPWLEVAQW